MDLIFICPQCGAEPKKADHDSNGRLVCPDCETIALESFAREKVANTELKILLVIPDDDSDVEDVLDEITFISFPKKRISEKTFERIVDFCKTELGLITARDI